MKATGIVRKIDDLGRVVVPIISQGDAIGSIMIIPKEGNTLGDIELKAAELGSAFLGRQMES